jgi:cytochrome c oxidase cbb3-type subunit I/II
MPPYPWLAKRPLDFASVESGVAAQVTLGVPYTPQQVKGAAELAREQGRQIAEAIVAQGGPKGLDETRLVALIAYLQRLGTDIKKSAAAAAPATGRALAQPPIGAEAVT